MSGGALGLAAWSASMALLACVAMPKEKKRKRTVPTNSQMKRTTLFLISRPERRRMGVDGSGWQRVSWWCRRTGSLSAHILTLVKVLSVAGSQGRVGALGVEDGWQTVLQEKRLALATRRRGEARMEVAAVVTTSRLAAAEALLDAAWAGASVVHGVGAGVKGVLGRAGLLVGVALMALLR